MPEQQCRTPRWSDAREVMRPVMEDYLRNLAARLLRISHASLDIGTARKLRELSREIDEKAEAFEAHHRDDDREDDGGRQSR